MTLLEAAVGPIEELCALRRAISEMLGAPPIRRPFLNEADLCRVLGTALGFRQMTDQEVVDLLGLVEDLARENHIARCAAFPEAPAPRATKMLRNGRWALMFAGDADYAAHVAAFAATPPLEPLPRRREEFLDRAWRQVVDHAEPAAAQYAEWQVEAAKLIGPLLARGADKTAVAAAIREKYPILVAGDVDEITDREAAWWLRCRLDRKIHVPEPETT